MVNYYELLKLPEAITHEEIEIAFNVFKSELKKFSPGIHISDAEFRLRQPEIWDAYKVLLNPETRKEHDELIERDRIHLEYERRNKLIPSEGEQKSSNRASFLFLVVVSTIFGLYFLVSKILEEPYKPAKWYWHHITEDVRIMLPTKADTLLNILPPYLTNYINKSTSYKSELSNGFCVTIAVIHMNEGFKISIKDLKYITSMEAQNPHLRMKSDIGDEINGSYKGYKMTIAKETYHVENIIRVCENYTLLKGLTAIKIIVNYNPGDPLQEKCNEIIFKSIN